MISPPIKASRGHGIKKPRRMKDSTVNKRLAVLDGWKKTEDKNWKSSDEIVCVLPPDYCNGIYALSDLISNLSLKKKREAARLILAWLEK